MNSQLDPAWVDPQLAEAKARLADIVLGCDMMLQDACNVTGAMRGFIEEVKRVAGTPL
jgi:hypothetical protein